MKIRSGFVSNSSSSSFLIYGICLEADKDKIRELLNITDEDFIAEIDERLKSKHIKQIRTIHGQDSTYLGRSWDSIKDDETGKQFKQSVKDEINELLPTLALENICSTHEEGWYDG